MAKNPPFPATAADYIEMLGGVRAVAAACGTSVENVCNWRNLDRFPARKYLLINGLFAQRGKRKFFVPATLFRMDLPPSRN